MVDMGAFAQIEKLETLAKLNGISVPRLRGFRLMIDEDPVNLKEAEANIMGYYFYADMVESIPPFSLEPAGYILSGRRARKIKKLVSRHADGTANLRWNRVHGKRRKNAKFLVKIRKKRIKEQVEMFNKYAGRADVLYIHARIGGGNWASYGDEVKHQPWFLGKVDDAFDSTYCDIYAKIEPVIKGRYDRESESD